MKENGRLIFISQSLAVIILAKFSVFTLANIQSRQESESILGMFSRALNH